MSVVYIIIKYTNQAIYLINKNKMEHQRRHQKRNSTIKQEQEQNKHFELQDDSSIQLRENTDVHYYDLDYSDQNQNNDIVSSSDQDDRQISHQEFMKMITTNQQVQNKRHQVQFEYQEQKYRKFKKLQDKSAKSNDYKRLNNRRVTPSTRDQSYNYQQGQRNFNLNQRNDPQKSSQNKNISKLNKQESLFGQNTVKQFRVDSFLNAHPNRFPNDKSKASRNYKQIKIQNEDSDFSLITLPEYDQDSVTSISSSRKIQHKKHVQQMAQKHQKHKKHQKTVQKSRDNDIYEGLNWRYQQAKLKFIDTFMPDSLRIGNNPFNMLKYMHRKSQLSFNILNIV